MSRPTIVDLADCSEFRQTLAARPPRIVHGAFLLLVALLAAAVAWSALVQANLVVRAPGRVRPAETATRIFVSASLDPESRVVEAPFEVGDVVHRGDVLVRLDTARLDNRIAKLERTAEAAQEELGKLSGLNSLLELQLESSRDKARSEVAQAEAAYRRAVDQRASEIRSTKSSVAAAKDRFGRAQQLIARQAIAQEDVIKAETALREAEEKQLQAELPVDDQRVSIARRALDLVDREFAIRRAELEARIAAKRGEAEAAEKELANLHIQRNDAVLKSPVEGVVIEGRIQIGDVLQPGKSVLEIAQRNHFRFEALVPSSEVGQLRVGMPVRIKFDAYDYQRYGVLEGKVTYISPDSTTSGNGDASNSASATAASADRPAAFLVRVDVARDHVGRGDLRGAIKLGLGGSAEIVVEQKSLLSIVLKRLRHSISLG